MTTTAAASQPQAGMKRKTSAAGLSGSGRPVKRRASKACHCCRSRKVRCDVVESGIPCTNCRLDEVECVVTEGKRRKKSYVENDVLNHSPIESIEQKEDIPSFPIFDDIDGLQDFTMPTIRPMHNETSDIHSFEYGLSHHTPHMLYQTQGHRLTPEERTRRLSAISQTPGINLRSPLHTARHTLYHRPTSSRPEVALPQYITPVSERLSAEDIEYLQRKGAFVVPDAATRNELLRSYVQFVHPYLPLIDLQEFLSTIERSNSRSTVSLLLFQAVMFAASAFIDMRFLTAQGYVSRKAARKALFQRVKLLYDFDLESDRVTVVQSVLLMTYWYESPNDPKDVWHWLGIAISLARTIGLNHNTEDSTLHVQKQRLWKRIWWCCYMRDRLIAIGMRRPIRIRDEDSSVSALTLDDFETDALPAELCRMLGGCSAVRDDSKRKTLARMCISLTEVCQRITDVLTAQYSVLGQKIGATEETTVRLVPSRTNADSSQVIKCDRALEEWYDKLPLELRYFVPGSRERTNNHDGEVISIHRALLTGIYLTATSALHRPQMMPVMPTLIIAPELKILSKRRVYEAAMDITEIFRDLHAHDLIRYLPNTGVTILLPAIIIHLLDIKSADQTDRQTSMRHFQFCMQALQRMREAYASADFAFSFLDTAVRASDLAAKQAKGGARTQCFDGRAQIPKKDVFEHKSAHQKDPALTPPPDLHVVLGRAVRQSSNLGDQSSPFAVLTPPSSEQSLSSIASGSAAISLDDLDNIIDLSDHHESECFTQAYSGDQNNNSTSILPADSTELTLSKPNEFDRMISLEGGADLFAPIKVDLDESLFNDIDMEWLADSNHDNDSTIAGNVGKAMMHNHSWSTNATSPQHNCHSERTSSSISRSSSAATTTATTVCNSHGSDKSAMDVTNVDTLEATCDGKAGAEKIAGLENGTKEQEMRDGEIVTPTNEDKSIAKLQEVR